MAKDNIQELYTAWSGNQAPAQLAPLVRALDPLIDKALVSYGFSKEPNMRTTARLHVIKALPRYRPESASLKTFVTSELKRIQRLGPQHRHTIRIPEQAALDLRSLRQQEQELGYELGRTPTVAELADNSKMSIRRIEKLRRQYSAPVLTEAAFQAPGMDGQLPGTQASNVNQKLWEDAIYDESDPSDQKIIEWTLGRGGAPVLTKTEMARNLRMSPSAVTQRSSRIAAKIQEGADHNLL